MGSFAGFTWGKDKREEKYSQAGTVISTYTRGQPVWTPRDYNNLSKEAYARNVISFRCVRQVASGVASVPWLLYRGKGGREVADHPLLDLLRKPNPSVAGCEFWEGIIAYYLLAGNSYCEAISASGAPKELWNLRPDRMKIIDGGYGLPGGYEYEANGVKKRWSFDPITGKSPILHFKDFHPTDDWYGLSTVEAAAYSIDQHNFAGQHNAALLQNGARPSGVMILKGNANDDEGKRVFQLLLDRYESPKNAGKPMVINGDAEWKEMSITPKELDFNESTLAVARNIALAFGVPPQLLGIPGDNTYSNYQEARLALWVDTILPLFERLCTSLNGWLAPMYGDRLVLAGDYDKLSALEPMRQITYDRTLGAYKEGILTLNEARERLGDEPIDGGDVVKAPAPVLGSQPADPKVKKKPNERKALTESELLLLPSEIDSRDVYASTQPLIDAMLADIVADIGRDVVEEVGERIAFGNTVRVQDYVLHQTGTLIRQINDTTRKQIAGQIGEAIAAGETYDKVADRVSSVFWEASQSRAALIAQTESTKAAGFAAAEAIVQSGLQRKRWVTTQDGHARESHRAMNGQVVPVEGKFRAPSGAEAPYPGAFASVKENARCRCAVVAVFDGEEKADTDREQWTKREKLRKQAEVDIYVTMQRFFDIQRDAVVERLKILDS